MMGVASSRTGGCLREGEGGVRGGQGGVGPPLPAALGLCAPCLQKITSVIKLKAKNISTNHWVRTILDAL